ncbi:uncharacterized protein LOC102809458 [Saccoglossus kowalevskii]|uniref:Uncharacterized protein LOC102809458 n=1 Tax=Saccoglossus kowalevskii TaxID=10224 RepID=A0ABM0MQJ6_SACKO|nr:PREDICTED: uncharacterized protein LOC102809458 [Saccoglossus kowalevskii]
MASRFFATFLLMMVLYGLCINVNGWRRRRRSCSPTDCILSSWSSWSSCSSECGTNGLKTRTRTLYSHATCGGSCGSRSESVSCNNDAASCHFHGYPSGSQCICYDGFHGLCCENEKTDNNINNNYNYNMRNAGTFAKMISGLVGGIFIMGLIIVSMMKN